MLSKIGRIDTMTMSRESYEAILRACDAVRLPVAGIIKRYTGFQYDDFGNRQQVFISSTEQANGSGEITFDVAEVNR